MSSEYRILCLSHDPAIVIPGTDWQSGAGGMEIASHAAAQPREYPETAGHVGCDLLIGRYSYPLVEVGCPPHLVGASRSCDFHREVEWVDVAWLRVLRAAWTAYPGAVAAAGLPRCWTPERAQRLRHQLAEAEGGPGGV